MANIKINDIKPAGAELFFDSESYLDQIQEDELRSVVGGVTPSTAAITGATSAASALTGPIGAVVLLGAVIIRHTVQN
ncbi:hypothetical protein BJP34_13215 [Moorena producens PAL-8-15-08-1]|uniref:Bacteriocin n=1 Tax=Moorena producens PAL-8-15-08-1 TaxID=1458985 RepID=A0A1D8TRL7_9CYAN|nr:hypothetical protein [Moorena producens]AOX00288.1 hypothetical protein BJP34_13215 [Moorena producens PAL-8-15-08-1]